MNKAEFIASIAEKGGMTKKAAGETVNLVLGTITDALVNGEEVALAGFGKFSVVEVEARERRNPVTGETFMAEAHTAPKFKCARNGKAEVR